MSHIVWFKRYVSLVRNRQLTLYTIITSSKPSQRSWRFIYQFNLLNTFKTNSKHLNSMPEFLRESTFNFTSIYDHEPKWTRQQSVKIIKCADGTFCQVLSRNSSIPIQMLPRCFHILDPNQTIWVVTHQFYVASELLIWLRSHELKESESNNCMKVM